MSSQWGSEIIRQSCADALITEDPYERIVHVRICGGRRGKPRPLPGTLPRTVTDPNYLVNLAVNYIDTSF